MKVSLMISGQTAQNEAQNQHLEMLGKQIFARPCHFVTSVGYIQQFDYENPLPQLAFAGRSNVGKSSLINRLVSQKLLARTSSTPGRTQCINFFDIRDVLMLVDLPGYGYGRASKKERSWWRELISYYLQSAPQLKRVFLLLDGRVELKNRDHEFMSLCDKWAISYQLVITKSDGVKHTQLQYKKELLEKVASKHPACVPWVIATSSKNGDGMQTLRRQCARLVLSRNKIEKDG